jgi:hypothetical protein
MVMFCTDSCEVKKNPANLPYDYYDLLLEPARFPEEQHNFEQTWRSVSLFLEHEIVLTRIPCFTEL